MHNLFLDVIGQENAVNILSEIYSTQRIPNAILLSGPEGIGKFFAAIQFLKLINDEKQNEKIGKLTEPFVKYIFPLPRGTNETNSDLPTSKLSQDIIDEINEQITTKSLNPYYSINIKKANNIKINSIRELNKFLSLNYDEVKYRGVIIGDAHKMSIEAQNAFLKNLEEPPEGIIYFLISSEPDLLLTTIKSRCWNVKFAPLKNNALIEVLKKYYSINENEIEDILPFAQGSVSFAHHLIENNFEDYLNKTILILRYSLAKKYFTAHNELRNVVNNSTDSFIIIIDLIINWLSDTLKQKHKIDNLSFHSQIETLEKFNQKFDSSKIVNVTAKLVELRNGIKRNVNLNILFTNVIFLLASIGNKVDE